METGDVFAEYDQSDIGSLTRNGDVLREALVHGEMDLDFFWDQTILEIELELRDRSVHLAKEIGRRTEWTWEFIQSITGAPSARCRQAVIDSRYPPASRNIRRKVLKRDAFTCQKCGSKDRVEVDHKVPRSLGGPNTLENLQALCHRCNCLKGSSLEDAR